MTALVDYRAARDAARSARKGQIIYPRLIPLSPTGTHWARQDYAGGPLIVLDPIPDPQSSGVINVAA